MTPDIVFFIKDKNGVPVPKNVTVDFKVFSTSRRSTRSLTMPSTL